MIPENCLQLYLLLGSIFMLLLSIGLLFDSENGNLKFIKPLLFYGKTLSEKNVLSNFSVPKSWFYIFYVVGEVLSLTFLTMIYLTPTLIIPFASWLYSFGYSKSVQSYETTLLIFICLSIHIGRRLYETLFISVYSPSTIHLSHFMMGIIHYIFLPLSVLVSSSLKVSENISFLQVIFTVLFIFLNYLQNGIANDFANLRKDENNKITNLTHKACLNGIHKFVCCPHFLYEILIYLSLYGIGRSQNLLVCVL
uniref:Polyprenal reductase n=1 Tax=Strongyloides venezuelensis TaxID=75913 RepID=A0A0K0F8W4_STRVS